MNLKNIVIKIRLNLKSQIYKTIVTIYLFFKYRYQILTTFIYIRKLKLNTKKLIIELGSRASISLPSLMYPIYNVSIANRNGKIVAVGRVSNARVEDKADLAGRPKFSKKLEGKLLNGIIKFNLTPDGKVSNLKFLHKISEIPNFEDPRVFFLKRQEFIVMTQVRSPIGDSKSGAKCGVVVENFGTKQIIPIPSPYGKGIEKNWVPIEKDNCVMLLYTSSPVTLIELDPNTDSYKLITTQDRSEIALNGRSQVIKSPHPEIPYIRVASKKYATRKYGYTALHYFEILSENLRPISLSRPFIFSSRRHEFCQGIAIVNSKLYLSWTEREKYNFIGSIELKQVMKLFN